MDYNELWRIVQKEKQSNDLQILQKSIYSEILDYINSFKNTNLSEESEIIKKNTIKLLDELYEKRKQKILIYVAYKKPIPQPTIKLEEDFYNKIIEIISKDKILDLLNNNKTLLKISKELNVEIRLPSGKLIGPLIKDSFLEVENKEDIDYLLNNSICIKP